MRRGTSSTVVVAVLTTAVLLLLLLWSAGNGTPLVSSPQGTFGEPRGEGSPDLTVQTQPPAEQGVDRGGREVAELTFNLALVLWLAAVVALAVLLARWLGRQRLEGQERREEAEEEQLVALLEATSDEVRYLALSEGDPRNAVVACWVALEDAVHRSGLRENRAQTAAELARSVLGRWDVDPGAVTSLSEAYREARFSRHPVSEEQRTVAVDALERIHVDLRRRAAEQELQQELGREQPAEGGARDQGGRR